MARLVSAREAQQPRNPLEMRLHDMIARHLVLREFDPGSGSISGAPAFQIQYQIPGPVQLPAFEPASVEKPICPPSGASMHTALR
jgi:hypothetical protein